MNRREAIVTAIAAVLPSKVCAVCGDVGIVTIRTGQYATVTVRCPMECRKAPK